MNEDEIDSRILTLAALAGSVVFWASAWLLRQAQPGLQLVFGPAAVFHAVLWTHIWMLGLCRDLNEPRPYQNRIFHLVDSTVSALICVPAYGSRSLPFLVLWLVVVRAYAVWRSQVTGTWRLMPFWRFVLLAVVPVVAVGLTALLLRA